MRQCKPLPAGYMITIRSYGTWLHGDIRGSTTRFVNEFGVPHLGYNPELLEDSRSRMRQCPYSMDRARRTCVLSAIVEVCEFKAWHLHAAHVREEHAHAVVSAALAPERIIIALKARSTRMLNQAGLDSVDRKRWARGGSRRYLWTEQQVKEAIRYILEEQGEPMETFRGRATASA